jgi:hypothetical protein
MKLSLIVAIIFVVCLFLGTININYLTLGMFILGIYFIYRIVGFFINLFKNLG